MYINGSCCRGRTLSLTSCVSLNQDHVYPTWVKNFYNLYKTSLRHIRKDLHLITQIRSDHHQDFVFCAAAEHAQVKQDDLPSHNTQTVHLQLLH